MGEESVENKRPAVLSLKVQKDNGGIRFSITDKSVRDELKLRVDSCDLVIVEIKEIIKKGNLLKTVPVRGKQ